MRSEDIPLERVRVRTLRDFLPRGTAGDIVAAVVADRLTAAYDHLLAM